MAINKNDPAEILKAQKVAARRLAKAERELAELAKTQPELARYWAGSAGHSILRSMAAGSMTLVTAA